MPKNKKKFNKKTAQSFSLVGRSLQPIGEDVDNYGQPLSREELEARKDEEHKYGIYFNDEYDYMSHLRDVSSFRGSLEPNDQFRIGQAASEMLLESLSVVSGRSSRAQSHPKPSSSSRPSLFDFSSLLPSGPINHEPEDAEPDPDILQAMREEFDFDDTDNILEDDFVSQAIGAVVIKEEDEDEYPGIEDVDSYYPGTNQSYVDPTKPMHKGQMVDSWLEHQDPKAEPDEAEGGARKKSERKTTAGMIKDWVMNQGEDDEDGENVMEKEEKRSRFSNYSITSSVMRRSEELRILDDHFEQRFREYDDEEIGGMDLDEHETTGTSLVLQSILSQKDQPPPESDPDEAKISIFGGKGAALVAYKLSKTEVAFQCLQNGKPLRRRLAEASMVIKAMRKLILAKKTLRSKATKKWTEKRELLKEMKGLKGQIRTLVAEEKIAHI